MNNRHETIKAADEKIREFAGRDTDGKWFETVVIESAPFITEWDLTNCYAWADWPERGEHYPDAGENDIGIDAVGVRADGSHVALQMKAGKDGRNLDWKGDLSTFVGLAAQGPFKEMWAVSNGEVDLSANARKATPSLTTVNAAQDIRDQLAIFESAVEPNGESCAHCESPDDPEAIQTKNCMQNDAISESVRILQEREAVYGGARGRIILPCGTGKTRVSLRIVENLTAPGKVSVVLCPSIALVAQIRREYLQHAEKKLDVLAVCSDKTAGYDPKKESVRNSAADPTVDGSNTSAREIKGRVTTDPDEIADWIKEDSDRVKVLIGTYQSSERVSKALLCAGVKARVLIADEAHRTAGIKKRRTRNAEKEEQHLRDFTVCHDSERFPATYRVYQTATPRIYSERNGRTSNDNWIVRSMDAEDTFGVELYRRSYADAVNNGWLSDYRIIALGVNDEETYEAANNMARETQSKGRRKLTTQDYMRGLTLTMAMGGALADEDVDVQSCIAFMNTVDKSKNMAEDLGSPTAREWLANWLAKNADGRAPTEYSIEHLDATSTAAKRDEAKGRLAEATSQKPHAITNVGIFGEGVDSPSLSAVAFLESRKSPVDVVQAVGRAMRKFDGKSMGYIIVPIPFPANADPEKWLSTSSPEDGWKELGQVLMALRAHDRRIEDNFEKMFNIYLPTAPAEEVSIVSVAKPETKRIFHGWVKGRPGKAEKAVQLILDGMSPQKAGVIRLGKTEPTFDETPPYQTVIGIKTTDGETEMRRTDVKTNKPKANQERGAVNIQKTKDHVRKIVNTGQGGVKIRRGEHKRKQVQEVQRRFTNLGGMVEYGDAIRINLLTNSGLSGNRVERDLNILEASVTEAARHLKAEGLEGALARHLGIDKFDMNDNKKSADGCTVAALLMMNAAMLHQRIANGRWLSGVESMASLKNAGNVIEKTLDQWNAITRHDFLPVIQPAQDALKAARDTGKHEGLKRALHHIAAEAEHIAETYADMGADHAGPLFNRVMGNQASDGAFFSRPPAASLAARLTLDATGETEWYAKETWERMKTIDLACGSGTLLAAMLTDMKRRAAEEARERGASDEQCAKMLTALQKTMVEDYIKGMDVNPVSLQLAASQLTAGNSDVRYKQMGLHLMPYGPDKDEARVSAGTLELLGQKALVARDAELPIADDAIGSMTFSMYDSDDADRDYELEDAVKAAKDVRVVIMNPPFTNRVKMGEKFDSETQKNLRVRVDQMQDKLTQADPGLTEFAGKSSVSPLFVGLADQLLPTNNGLITMINPTIVISAPSGIGERQMLAERYHIHTVLTCHQPGNVNMSQHTGIHESIVVMRRHNGAKPPTRFINLDRMPTNDEQVDDFHRALTDCEEGLLAKGWGEVSYWPAERMEAGDWTPAIWRSSELAEAAARYANDEEMARFGDMEDVFCRLTQATLHVSFRRAAEGDAGAVPIVKSKGGDKQQTIKSEPDEYWLPKDGKKSTADKLRQKASHLLITGGQNSGTARLVAIASDAKYSGGGWMPVEGVSLTEAKAMAVFLNSTIGRIQLMRNAGQTLAFTLYRPLGIANIRFPDVKDARILDVLAACWDLTKDEVVPQFRDGECAVRALWDEAVAEAMGWDADEIARLRNLLHREPHVRGLGYNQYADESDED